MNIKIEKDIPIPRTKWETIRDYKWNHIAIIAKLNKGESIIVKNRTRETVRIWAWLATRSLGFKSLKDLKDMYLVKTIDKKNQRVWKLK